MANKNGYDIDMSYAVVPGETLKEVAEELGLSHKDLAERLGITPKTISKIVNGTAPITPETALNLERVLGISSNFWNQLELNYREKLTEIEAEAKLKDEIEILREYVPYKEIANAGFVPKTRDPKEKVENTLNYFGFSSLKIFIESINDNQLLAGAYRIKEVEKVNKLALMAWIRAGEIAAQEIEAEVFSKEKLKKSLPELRNLTLQSDPSIFIPELQRICASFGVKVVFVPEVKGSKVCGLTRWLTPKPQAIIQLSLRYKSNDNLWFTFFHELGHILKHNKVPFYTASNEYADSIEEQEANEFSANTLIPKDSYNDFIEQGRFTKTSICNFADMVSIHPGIVLGRLQKEKHVQWNKYNELKARYSWK
ncbi:HigA family addiction module antitoxin [Enterococcus pernyi]|uniref:HigA family addiction module antitoxin n=1 Tax=Enterococcus pernyi TaxID=590158 RepID=UPI000789B34B|nr:HigA family addiction module antitoxin [Enterococcus pernyi]